MWQKFKMEDCDLPCAVILFHSDLDFSQASAFCSDMDIDVLETEIYGYSCLVFFLQMEFSAVLFFCNVSGFSIDKYIHVKCET